MSPAATTTATMVYSCWLVPELETDEVELETDEVELETDEVELMAQLKIVLTSGLAISMLCAAEGELVGLGLCMERWVLACWVLGG